MKTNVLKLIDFERFNSLLEGFNKSTGFVTAVLDLEGNLISKSGWRSICTDFHRVNPETKKNCLISDTILANQMTDGRKYHIYKCHNGLIDVAVPIIVKEEHVANLFTGQFFIEKPNYTFFKEQAKKFGFDETSYINAIKEVPIVRENQIKEILDFLLNLTEMIVDLTLDKIEKEHSEMLLKSSLESPKDMIILAIDKDYNYLYFNDAHKQAMKYAYDQIVTNKMNIMDCITSDVDKVNAKTNYDLALSGKAHRTLQQYGDKEISYYETFYNPIYNDKKEVIGATAFARDVSESIKTINLLKDSEKRLDMFFQQSLTGFFIMMIDEPVYWNDTVDKEKVLDYIFDHQRCTRVNQAMLDQYNVKLDDFLLKTPREMFAHNIKEGKDTWRKMLDNKLIHTITDERKSDGTRMFIEGDYICMYDSLGRVIGHFGNQQEVTNRIQRQNEIEYLSNHDYLTGLHNRRYYFEQFNNLDNERLYPLGVMMLDVNGLKIINDAFGHAVGDIALKTIGKVLKNTFEQKDIVSRIGGDEFAVLLPKSSFEELQQYKDKLKYAVKKHKIENIEMSLAIGYELKINQDEDVDDLLKLAENHMYRHKLTEGSSVRNRAISAILETLTDKYNVEREHSKKVSYYCKLIGQHLKLRNDEMIELEQAGLFHDIGKISIPDIILNKPGKLTDEEYDIIKTHTEVGYQILRAADEYSDLAIHALHHHERWDGKGYPTGMKENEIPLFSRIIGVVDAYEAMTSDRPYRKKKSEEYAIQELKKYSGTQFDPKITKIFIEKVLSNEFPNQKLVKEN
jgi:diguanylate cyclase (GGDEF)-like protein/PAS domain S-box-containing protein